MDQIPIIDFGKFSSGDSGQKLLVAKEFTEAIKTYGFAYLKNYGISSEKVQQMFEASKAFFDCNLEIKQSASKNHATNSGYDEMESEKLSNNRPADLKESFMIRKIGTPWPVTDNLPGFKEKMLDYYAECYSLAASLVKAISIGLDLNENAIYNESNFNGECTVLRILHYPPTQKPVLPNQLRCGEHTDYGGLTILFQDPTGGLEIKTKQGDWIPAPYIPETAIINIGDSMEMWTSGYLKSTPHRVVNAQSEGPNVSRYSTAFFFDPDLNSELKSLEEFKEVNNTEFTAKTYKEHVSRIFQESYPNAGFDFEKKLETNE